MDQINAKTQYQQDANLLLKDFNAGQQLAFRYIFETTYRAMVLFAENILIHHTHEVEDIVQDAFIKLWSRNKEFQHLPQVRTFLYTTVKNTCLDKLRHIRVSDKYQDHAGRQQSLQEADFVEPIITAETIRLINEAIEALPQQGRNVFKLSLSGLKNDEIAARLNISENTVKTHKQRALNTLRANLGDAMLILILLSHGNLLK